MIAILSRRLAMQALLALIISRNLAPPSFADSGSDDSDNDSDSDNESDDQDQDEHDDLDSSGREQKEIRDAVAGSKAVSLSKLLEHIKRSYDGEVLDIRLRSQKGNYFYAIKMISTAGRIFRLQLNAQTLAKF